MSDAVADGLLPARRVRAYWDAHIHDLAITRHEVASRISTSTTSSSRITFDGWWVRRTEGRVLDVGCGTGVDLVHFARGGGAAIGIDVSEAAIRLAAANLGLQQLPRTWSSATVRRCRLPTRPSTTCSPTVSCRTPPMIDGSWRSPAGC